MRTGRLFAISIVKKKVDFKYVLLGLKSNKSFFMQSIPQEKTGYEFSLSVFHLVTSFPPHFFGNMGTVADPVQGVGGGEGTNKIL